MKTIQYVLLITLCYFLSCDQQSTTPVVDDNSGNPDGLMKITMDMTDAPSEVDRIEGILYNDDGDEIYFDFEIDENSATALVENIPSGNWILRVDAYDEDDNLIYTGTTEITVYAGVVTPVSLHLNPATGSLAIIVMWGETCKDIDGNVYRTVKIGNQIWMAENLKVTHYSNGDAIPEVAGNTEWADLTSGAYCHSPLVQEYFEIYGLLYNWYAVSDSRNIAPEGWHVPTDQEWKELEMYLGMSESVAELSGMRGTDEGGKLKEIGTDNWKYPNTGATNESGFTALGGGGRDFSGYFFGLGEDEDWWSGTEVNSTTAWTRGLDFDRSDTDRWMDVKQCGFSVRCIKD